MVVFLDSSAGHEGIGDIIGLLLWVRPGGVYLRICERSLLNINQNVKKKSLWKICPRFLFFHIN